MRIKHKENGAIELFWKDKSGANVCLETKAANAAKDIVRLILGKEGMDEFHNICSLNQPMVLFPSLKKVFKNCLSEEEFNTLMYICQDGDNCDLKFLSIYLYEEDYKDLVGLVKDNPVKKIVEIARANSLNFEYRHKLDHITGNDELSKAILEDILGAEFLRENKELIDNAGKVGESLRTHFDNEALRMKKTGEWVDVISNNIEELRSYAKDSSFPVSSRVKVLMFNPAIGIEVKELVDYFLSDYDEIEDRDKNKLLIAREIWFKYSQDEDIRKKLINGFLNGEAAKLYRMATQRKDEKLQKYAMEYSKNVVKFITYCLGA